MSPLQLPITSTTRNSTIRPTLQASAITSPATCSVPGRARMKPAIGQDREEDTPRIGTGAARPK